MLWFAWEILIGFCAISLVPPFQFALLFIERLVLTICRQRKWGSGLGFGCGTGNREGSTTHSRPGVGKIQGTPTQKFLFSLRLCSYSFSSMQISLGDPGGYREHSEMYRKFQYIKREALTEFGLSNPRTLEFYGALFFVVFNYWFRMYARYTGEWVMTKIIGTRLSTCFVPSLTRNFLLGVPVYAFTFLPYTVLVIYTPDLLPKIDEALIVMAGPLFLILLFGLFVLFAWLWQKLVLLLSLVLFGLFCAEPGVPRTGEPFHHDVWSGGAVRSDIHSHYGLCRRYLDGRPLQALQ